jgi:hypothetical protein
VKYVYVVEVGAYSDRYVAGVYATPEAAMAAHPCPEWDRCAGVLGDDEYEEWHGSSGYTMIRREPVRR